MIDDVLFVYSICFLYFLFFSVCRMSFREASFEKKNFCFRPGKLKKKNNKNQDKKTVDVSYSTQQLQHSATPASS
jgi:hypothetical protein